MRRLLVVIVAVVLVVAIGGGLYYQWGVQAADPAGRERLVYLPEGQGVWAIASALEDEGLIRSAAVFYVAYRLYIRSGKPGNLTASYFDLSPADPVPRIISEGLRRPARRRLTFPEGFFLKQIAARVGASELRITEQAFSNAARRSLLAEQPAFELASESLEGYLFPDTYQIAIGTSAEEIVAEMLGNFEHKFCEKYEQQIAASSHSLHEIVTMASLIEREAKTEKDRGLIASVIDNRLAKGMKLQIDATVQYALPEHKERLLHSDLKVASPYNTYLHEGLPPGPICNPGLACLEAALNPPRTEYFYYVAREDGSHVFSRTYAEHLRAIGKARR